MHPDPPGPHDDTAEPSAHEPDGTSLARARQQMPAGASQLDERTSQKAVMAKFALFHRPAPEGMIYEGP